MTACPPIPDEAWDAVSAFFAASGRGFNDLERDALRIAASHMWREWTRGKAVVPLPEPDYSPGELRQWYGGNPPNDISVAAAVCDGNGPVVDVQLGSTQNFVVLPPDVARLVAGGLLAAADRADQLATQDQGGETR